MRVPHARRAAGVAVLASLCLFASGAPANASSSDEPARRLAEKVLEAVGGRDGESAARHRTWHFFGGREWAWDTWTGRARLRDGELVVLFDVESRQGRAWRSGEPLVGEQLAETLKGAHAAWINDSYWMFMPFKLLDPGVRLSLRSEGTPGDHDEHVLRVTFDDGVGLTPQNAYDVVVDPETHLVTAWSFYPEAPGSDDAEPRFTLPWAGWRWFGPIRLATDHGRGADWRIGVHEELPDALYEDPHARMPGDPRKESANEPHRR